MKLPRGFFIFLIIAQIILLIGHYALYGALTVFFPFFASHNLTTFIVLMVLAVSFLGFSILDFRSESEIFRIGYIAAGVWLPAFLYLLLASMVLIIIDGFNFNWRAIGLQYLLFWLAIVISGYGVINARIARVTSVKVKLPNLPEFWKNKTAVLATDLHLGHVLRYGFAGKVITNINKLHPDFVR